MNNLSLKSIYCALLLSLFAHPASADFAQQLSDAALERTQYNVRYDGSYHRIDYPNGDVPKHIGVCTDVLIRSYRAIGIDLQKLVHEDMRASFSSYPSKRIWGLSRPDTNIDHRRVPNLEAFFKRHGQSLDIEKNPDNYLPGDIVSWRLAGGLPHIGIVVNQRSKTTGNPMIVHNIGSGPKMEDVLFSYPMVGHFRFQPRDDDATNETK